MSHYIPVFGIQNRSFHFKSVTCSRSNSPIMMPLLDIIEEEVEEVDKHGVLAENGKYRMQSSDPEASI